LKKNFPL